ncbi:hypothetical protein Glove_487g60 [Diversispora epigaea]|uniref:Uncharacterized protein n=1 Tax=Diversispora epigaea TaxID=1348612 RepID=A0A397GIY5_9GLOM|nr:hypothetical protein Glove_487g60 [Diversispora epigaea]
MQSCLIFPIHTWPDIDTSVYDILSKKIRELLLCSECYEPIFTNPQQKNINPSNHDVLHTPSSHINLVSPNMKKMKETFRLSTLMPVKTELADADMIEVPITRE